MRFAQFALLVAALSQHSTAASSSDDAEEEATPPCTIKSPLTNSFFDLTRINRQPLDPDSKKNPKDAKDYSWHARGFDYGANFTLNFCGPVVEPLANVEGVPKQDWKKIAGFYEMDGKNYSLGQNNSTPVLRGRKLVLNYTDGSPCPTSLQNDRRSYIPSTTEYLHGSGIDNDEDDDDDDPDRSRKGRKPVRRKTTIISLLCERDPTKPAAAISFVASPDDCTYFFEARTSAACPTVNVQKQTFGPSGVFAVIAVIAILVYLIGGVVYQRVVMHQRGWRQLPNYALWASMVSFVKDMVVIAGASCLRCLPGGGGRSSRRWLGGRNSSFSYSGLSNGSAGERGHNGSAMPGRGGRTRSGTGAEFGGRNGDDDENRLIDQLDEEWDD